MQLDRKSASIGLGSRTAVARDGGRRRGSARRPTPQSRPIAKRPSRSLGTCPDVDRALVQAASQGIYEGLKRYFDAHFLIGDGGGLGGGSGGVINASYGGGGLGPVTPAQRARAHAQAAALPSLRFGRGADGAYRDTPHRAGTVRGGTDLGRDALPSDMPPTHLGRTGSKFSGKAPAIMRGLMDRYGLTQEQAAGVLGNLGHESAGFTAYHEGKKAPGEGGVGWAQWTGSRRRDFERWTAAHGLNPTSDEASWRFLTEGDPEMPGAIAAVKRTNNRRDATRAFHDHFERSADIKHGVIVKPKNWNSRLDYADKAFVLGPGAPQTPAYADESRRGFAAQQRDAERAVLPRSPLLPRPERQAPTVPPGPRVEAMNAGVDFDHSGVLQAIEHVDRLHAKLRALKAEMPAPLEVRHRHEGEPGGGSRPGALRTALNGGYASDGRSWS